MWYRCVQIIDMSMVKIRDIPVTRIHHFALNALLPFLYLEFSCRMSASELIIFSNV